MKPLKPAGAILLDTIEGHEVYVASEEALAAWAETESGEIPALSEYDGRFFLSPRATRILTPRLPDMFAEWRRTRTVA